MFCREFYSRRVYAFFVLFFLGKKCARANFYTFRMSADALVSAWGRLTEMSMNEVIFLSIPDIILYKEHILQYVAV